MESLIPLAVQKILLKQQYQLVGRHSAVKKCTWTHKTLLGGSQCYKNKFYGIQSHRCIQMTPAAIFCNHHCLHCWRVQPQEANITWSDNSLEHNIVDTPATIVEGTFKAQKRILSGYNPIAHNKVTAKLYQEALTPKHVAISLSGEPTLYPSLSTLIDTFHQHDMTTFLVTNGTNPEVLKKITEPTQLYISINAPDKTTYKRICRPTNMKNWYKINESLKLLSTFNCPTTIRLTLIKNYNLNSPEKYTKLVEMGNPSYVEAKGYMHVGFSQQRLNYGYMPSHQEIRQFADTLSMEIGYTMYDEVPLSRVCLLTRLQKPIRFS